MQAGLIICYAGTGRTASLVAKYRPNVPILTLVVPQLKSKGLVWELEGRSLARQFLIMRGEHHLHALSPCPAMCELIDVAGPQDAGVRVSLVRHIHIVQIAQ